MTPMQRTVPLRQPQVVRIGRVAIQSLDDINNFLQRDSLPVGSQTYRYPMVALKGLADARDTAPRGDNKRSKETLDILLDAAAVALSNKAAVVYAHVA
jgi:hypothetical protein